MNDPLILSSVMIFSICLNSEIHLISEHFYYRYQKRKSTGKLKSASELDGKALKRQQHKWRQNSARYFKNKKQLENLLNLTPPSFDESPGPSQRAAPSTSTPTPAPAPARRALIPVENDGNDVPPRTSTPAKRRPVVSNLRAKLKKKDKALETKDREIDRLRKTIQRMKMRKEPMKNSHAKGSVSSAINKRHDMARAIRKFLHRDDISTIVNGKAGEIRRCGQVFRRRFLCDGMENLHKRFLEENPSKKISRAQFFKLRPFWISSPTVLDRETCACKIHENFESKVKKLHLLGLLETSSSCEVMKSVVCDMKKVDCMYRRCKDCKEKTFSPVLNPATKHNIVQWKEWVNRSTPIMKKQADGSTVEAQMKVTKLEECSATTERLVSLTNKSLPRFCQHAFNLKHQFVSVQRHKEGLRDTEAVVHVDYSENYICKWNKEIQEVHFGGSHRQVALHTGVIYTVENVESFASLSDCLRHDAAATWAHLNPILEYIRAEYPNVTKLHFLSDGPTSQYRNKSAFYLASTVPLMKGFKYISWNFTEASHGKGAPDGVGAALKTLADRTVARGTDLPDMQTLLTNLRQHSSVKIFEVKEEDILKAAEMIPPSLKTVFGTMAIHQVKTI